MHKTLRRILLVCFVVLFSGYAVAQTQAPPTPAAMGKWIGRWELNAAKSTFKNNPLFPPESNLLKQVIQINVADGKVDLYIHMGLSDGTDVGDETHNLELNGKEHVATIEGLGTATETFRQIDENTFDIHVHVRMPDLPDIEVVASSRFTISPDGKTLTEMKTYSYTGLTASGTEKPGDTSKPETSVLVFDKHERD